jgi:hypothetical protein
VSGIFVFYALLDTFSEGILMTVSPPEPEGIVIVVNPTTNLMSPTVDPIARQTAGAVDIITVVVAIFVASMPRADRVPFISERSPTLTGKWYTMGLTSGRRFHG